jgi:hypothetical protein
MAKDKPQGSTAQYKVLLKPTDIGLLVMRRLSRPHVDKSTELRRLIELGYAAEQAGFILDGTALRHAGRMWDTQPDLGSDAHGVASPVPASPQAGLERHPARRTKSGERDADMPAASAAQGDPQVESARSDASPTGTSSLRGNLRNLSG